MEAGSMPLFMDTHRDVQGLTAAACEAAHARDVEVQAKYGARYLRYWYDETTGKIFCLVEAPSVEVAIAVHREAHGMVADEIVAVTEGV